MLQTLFMSVLTFYSIGETEKKVFICHPKWSQFTQQLYPKILVLSTKLHFVGRTLH